MRDILRESWRFVRTLAGRVKFWIISILNSDAYDCLILVAMFIAMFALIVAGTWCLTYGPINWIIR